jgi:hypothetical protein
MPRKSSTKVDPRTREQILEEMQGTEASCSRLRRLLDKTLSEIRSTRFTLYVVDDDGKRKRNPALKDMRELEGSLRAAMRHLAALRAEEAALLGSAHAEESPLDEFAPQVK